MPTECGSVVLTGLGGDALSIPIWGLGVLRSSPGGDATITVKTLPDGLVSASMDVNEFWTYDGLYDPTTGAWIGP